MHMPSRHQCIRCHDNHSMQRAVQFLEFLIIHHITELKEETMNIMMRVDCDVISVEVEALQHACL